MLEPMRPQDVPDELVAIVASRLDVAGLAGMHVQVLARDLLAHSLPAHEAMVRGVIGQELYGMAEDWSTQGAPGERLRPGLLYAASELDPPVNPAAKQGLPTYRERIEQEVRAKVAEEQNPSTGLTVYPPTEKLYGRCETCGEVRWRTETWRQGQPTIRSEHCKCCTHPHDLKPGGHSPWPARGGA